jgi:hypothetical protein
VKPLAQWYGIIGRPLWKKPRIQKVPIRVELADQVALLFSRPTFDLFFPGNAFSTYFVVS